MPEKVLPSIRYMFYLFVWAIPFETASTETVSILGSIPMILGMALTGAALLQPRVCFNTPPGAFWCFVGYLVLCLALGTTENIDYIRPVLSKLFTLAQLLVLMCISFNLFQYPEICRNALLVFVAACAVLSVLLVFGVGTVKWHREGRLCLGTMRIQLGATLSLGLITLLGLTYGRNTVERRITSHCMDGIPDHWDGNYHDGITGLSGRSRVGIALLIFEMEHGRLN